MKVVKEYRDVDDMVRRTEVGFRRRIDRRVEFIHPDKAPEDTTVIWVDWRPATVGNWARVLDRRGSPVYATPTDLERRIWIYMFSGSNLVDEDLGETSDGKTNRESFQALMRVRPAQLLTLLVRPVLESAYVTPQEVLRLEQESYRLWANEGSTVNNPHPLFAEVLTASMLYDKLGVSYYDDVKNMPQRKLEYIRKVFEYEAKVREMNRKASEAARSARGRYARR